MSSLDVFDTFQSSNGDKSIKEEQPSNIDSMRRTCDISQFSKPDKSINEEQLQRRPFGINAVGECPAVAESEDFRP